MADFTEEYVIVLYDIFLLYDEFWPVHWPILSLMPPLRFTGHETEIFPLGKIPGPQARSDQKHSRTGIFSGGDKPDPPVNN